MAVVKTGAAGEYRTLRFTSIDEVLTEIDRIEESERMGTLKRTGNWTAGQIFGHLAAWINYGWIGYPKAAHPPFFLRWVIRRQKAKILRDGMPRGARFPHIKEGTLATEPMTTTEGASRLRQALIRFRNGEPALYDSPAFGPMDDDDRIAFQLRHAELHLGYLQP